MTKNVKRPLNEREKQINPMPGETDPKDAFIKARVFAKQAKARQKKSK